MQFRHDFSNMEKEESKKRKERVPTKKELLNNLNQENQKETEKWADLKYYKKETYQSHQILEKLSCEKIANGTELSQLSQEDYFKLIFKNINNEAITEKLNEKVYLIEKIISCNDLMKYPLQDQMQIIFKKASVLSFDIILNVLGVQKETEKTQSKGKKLKENQALELILAYAQILKSGNFIFKSENKYDYVIDLAKRDYMIKQRNTIIQFLQNNAQNGIKKNYFNDANAEILKEVLNESCECVNGSYFLRESIFSKAKAEEFKKNYKEFYLKGISYWQNFAYDTNIKLGYVSDEQILKQIEDLEIIENNLAHPTIGQKRKYSFNYANSSLSASKKDENRIKAPLALSRHNNSGRDLLGDSDYKIERMKDGNEKLTVKSKLDGFAAEKIENKMQIDEENITVAAAAEFSYSITEKKIEKKSDKNLIKIENNGNADFAHQAVKSEAGINLNILKESLLKNFSPDSTNKKSDILNSIYNEFPDLKKNLKTDEIVSKLVDEIFVEIRNNLYLKEIEDKEANQVWIVLLDMFLKGNSYKKADIKKELNEKNIQVTDQNLNKILKKIAVYTNSSWNLKE